MSTPMPEIIASCVKCSMPASLTKIMPTISVLGLVKNDSAAMPEFYESIYVGAEITLTFGDTSIWAGAIRSKSQNMYMFALLAIIIPNSG